MNTRLIVIEKTISFEEDISKLLGLLLNIDWKNSKSLGFSSSSLSFSQKITIIHDIIGDEVEEEGMKKQKNNVNKLKCLTEIRNKFAHVKSIDTFEKLFKMKNGKEIKKNLVKWYPTNQEFKEEERKYHYFFNKLSADINSMIWDIALNYGIQKVIEDSKKQSNKVYVNEFQKEILGLADGEKRNNKIIDEVLEKLKKDDSIIQDIMQKFSQ